MEPYYWVEMDVRFRNDSIYTLFILIIFYSRKPAMAFNEK